MKRSGQLLRQVREKKGVSLQQVYQATKIPVEILDNIEADRITSISPAYLKGYLKIYSAYLGLELPAVWEGYRDLFADNMLVSGGPSGADKSNSAKRRSIPAGLRLFVVLLLALGLILWLRPRANETKPSSAGVVSTSRAQKKADKARHKAAAGKKSGKKTGKKAKKKAAKKTTKKARARKKKKVVSPRGSGIRLAIRAKENTYVRVKADGRPVFRAVLKKGRAENWAAKERMEVSLGNAGGVEVEINGKLLPSLGRRKQPIKDMVINRDGTVEIR
ncbi:MAG: helix-turn-helix domain-containing protein [Candidatus Omnitrophota bacterium]